MSPTVGLPLFLGITLCSLAIAVTMGLKGRVRPHLFAVAAALVSLAVTILYAKELGERFDLEAAGWIAPFHLTLAKITTAAYLFPIVTGLRRLKDRSKKRLHRWAAITVLTMTVVSAVTGCIMIYEAPAL